jgi:predicted RNase H-like nuclease
MGITIIGIDCATRDERLGLALGYVDGDAATIEQVLTGAMVESVVETVAGWATAAGCTLLALDAPLGWPAGLGQSLQGHQAGAALHLAANSLFRRVTDKAVRQATGKRPLDVGAERIARTAHAALALLQELRERTGQAIPLAWDPALGPGIWAIEVYPAGTLAACGVAAQGYKRREGRAARQSLLGFLGEQIRLPADCGLMVENDDALDAALCVLAGVDFLRGRAMVPEALEIAAKEGWIWVRRPV